MGQNRQRSGPIGGGAGGGRRKIDRTHGLAAFSTLLAGAVRKQFDGRAAPIGWLCRNCQDQRVRIVSIYALKGRFQDPLRPAVRGLYRMGITANAVTVTAAVVSLLVAAAVWCCAPAQPLYLLLPLWMLLRMALNAVDGMLAREFGQQSRLGAYLNELCDVIADAALYLSLLMPGVRPEVLWLLAWTAALSEYAGVLGLMVGASRRYDGPMGRVTAPSSACWVCCWRSSGLAR